MRLLSPADAVLVALMQFQGYATPAGVRDTRYEGYAVCMPVSTIMEHTGLSKRQVNDAIRTLKNRAVMFLDTGEVEPLLQVVPGLEGRRGRATVYHLPVRNEHPDFGRPFKTVSLKGAGKARSNEGVATSARTVAPVENPAIGTGKLTKGEGNPPPVTREIPDPIELIDRYRGVGAPHGAAHANEESVNEALRHPLFEPGSRLFYAICPKCGKRASAVLNDRGEAETRDACGSNHIELPEDRKAVKNENGVYVLEEVKEDI